MPPLNLVADFGGGGMLLAFGMLCAILNARATGTGQVVDATMVDGVNALAALFHGFRAMGLFDDGPGESFLGGAAHWYDTYETKDGRYVSIAALEPQFYDLMIDTLELDREIFERHVFRGHVDDDVRAGWAALKPLVAEAVKKKTLVEWRDLLEGTDICFAPVLTLAEAIEHPHNRARNTFVEVDGHVQPAPAPRFSETPNDPPRRGVMPGTHSREVLQSIGYSPDEVDALIASGAVQVGG